MKKVDKKLAAIIILALVLTGYIGYDQYTRSAQGYYNQGVNDGITAAQQDVVRQVQNKGYYSLQLTYNNATQIVYLAPVQLQDGSTINTN